MKTGLVKYGVTWHYEQVSVIVKAIPCPVRPTMIFIDHDEPEPADDSEVED